MSNDAFLLNTDILTSDMQELQAATAGGNVRHVLAAEASNRVPVPWLCCFRRSDLRQVELSFQTGPNQFDRMKADLPCVSVAGARRNLEASLPLFEAIVGNAAVAQGYWRAALQGLERMSLPYLTINPIEVFLLNDPAEENLAFSECLDGTVQSIQFIKRLAFYQDGFEPYTVEQLHSCSPDELDHEARRSNSAALDAGLGFTGDEESPSTAPPHTAMNKPWWKLW
jgi:hypothetical protein